MTIILICIFVVTLSLWTSRMPTWRDNFEVFVFGPICGALLGLVLYWIV